MRGRGAKSDQHCSKQDVMTLRTTSDSALWLTPRRLRAHATILALCLWSLYGWNMATPGLRDRQGNLKGTDFLHFYTLGSLAVAHRGSDLYDMNAQAVLAAQRVPEASGIRYLPLYPPQVSIFFAPLADLSYGWALGLWWACSALLYGFCCYGCLARVSKSARIWWHGIHGRDRVPRILSSDCLGPNFRAGTSSALR